MACAAESPGVDDAEKAGEPRRIDLSNLSDFLIRDVVAVTLRLTHYMDSEATPRQPDDVIEVRSNDPKTLRAIKLGLSGVYRMVAEADRHKKNRERLRQTRGWLTITTSEESVTLALATGFSIQSPDDFDWDAVSFDSWLLAIAIDDMLTQAGHEIALSRRFFNDLAGFSHLERERRQYYLFGCGAHLKAAEQAEREWKARGEEHTPKEYEHFSYEQLDLNGELARFLDDNEIVAVTIRMTRYLRPLSAPDQREELIELTSRNPIVLGRVMLGLRSARASAITGVSQLHYVDQVGEIQIFTKKGRFNVAFDQGFKIIGDRLYDVEELARDWRQWGEQRHMPRFYSWSLAKVVGELLDKEGKSHVLTAHKRDQLSGTGIWESMFARYYRLDCPPLDPVDDTSRP